MGTPNKQLKTGAELESLLEQLEDPFDPSEIKWRVTHTTRDGGRGAVVAFADQRAYTDRLNRIFTPSGWTRTYDVSEVTSLSRIKREKVIQTGKVLVTCALAIGALGTHTGCGEEWADEENALTSAEAQAFKRAASCFGLGRYLYNFVEMWVPLNEQRQPMKLPQLPKWALPKALGGGGRAHPPRPVAAQRGPIDQKTTARIEGFRRILGNEIYREVLWRAADADKAEAIPNAQLQQNVMEAMERAARGIRRANSVAEQIGETPFIAVLDRLQIISISDIPRLETLKALVAELEREVGRPAALLHARATACAAEVLATDAQRLPAGRDSVSASFEYFPGSFGCPLLWREDSYEECKDDPAGAAASQHPGGRSGLLRELRAGVELDELPLWRLRQ